MKQLVTSTLSKFNPLDESESEVYQAWKFLNQLSAGNKIFSYVLGKYVPYTGSISALVKEVRPGFARVELDEHRKVRNHLNSIHAIALANLCELTGNLALFSGMPPNGRFIVTGMELDYEKKARGTVEATSETPELTTNEESEYEIDVTVKDEAGDVTTRARIITLVGPR